ncbi:MAG: YkgJ family cysteine cluster protein [Rhodospirillaceae bacterium]|nr:YkgJ family cysteine cluster protein [Rhodospirillaceae bacterium]
MTERLDRSQRRRLLKEDEAWIGKPLPPNPPRRAAEAHVRHLALILRDTDIRNRAVQAAVYAGNVFDATMNQLEKGATACAKGCFHCCTKLVMVTLPDIFRLAQAVRGKVIDITAAAEASRRITSGHAHNQALPCPVLTDQACSAYGHRPIPCRFLLSKSLDACLRIFRDNSGEAFPYADHTTDLRQRMDQIVQTALVLSGLPHHHYELIQSLAVALTVDNAEERWLAGEPLFASVPANAQEFKYPAVAAAIEKLAADIRPTL